MLILSINVVSSKRQVKQFQFNSTNVHGEHKQLPTNIIHT